MIYNYYVIDIIIIIDPCNLNLIINRSGERGREGEREGERERMNYSFIAVIIV